MKQLILFLVVIFFFNSCKNEIKKESIIKEVIITEKAFEKMTVDSGIAVAFREFADSNAVILRDKDSLIIGKQQIYDYYNTVNNKNACVSWNPDFVEISEDGTMAYTYGKYCWKMTDSDSVKQFNGIFHTVWKKQKNGKWKYVWD